MFPALIGLATALVIIFVFRFIKGVHEDTLYGLLLSGIGFIYVGFAWSSWEVLVANVFQATAFIFIAYWGIIRSNRFLITGYFLHGVWDLCFGLFFPSALIPPHYDWFCLTVDFALALYLLARRGGRWNGNEKGRTLSASLKKER